MAAVAAVAADAGVWQQAVTGAGGELQGSFKPLPDSPAFELLIHRDSKAAGGAMDFSRSVTQ